MEQHSIKSLGEFVNYCEALDLAYDTLLFRGQGNRGDLLPGIARRQPRQDTRDLEEKMLQQFRLQGASMLRSPEPTKLELLVLAQHFGLKTRLLDWTSSSLAALWFACNSRSVGDVYVYVLKADSFQLADIYDADPFEQVQTLVFQPRLDNERILAQNGWFTLHRFSNQSQMFVPLEDQGRVKQNLTEIVVDGGARFHILGSLSRLGVNSRSLFPDLEGLCTHLNSVFEA